MRSLISRFIPFLGTFPRAIAVLVALMVALMVGIALLSISIWNSVLVPMTGAALITSVVPAVLFWLGLAVAGRFIGLIAFLAAIVLVVTDGQIRWLDMTFTAGPLFVYALFCSFFGGPRGTSSPSAPYNCRTS